MYRLRSCTADGIVNSLQKRVMEGGRRAKLHGQFVCRYPIVILAAGHPSPRVLERRLD